MLGRRQLCSQSLNTRLNSLSKDKTRLKKKAHSTNNLSVHQTDLASRAVPHLRIVKLLPLQEAVHALAHTQRLREAVSTQGHARVVLNLRQAGQIERYFSGEGEDILQMVGRALKYQTKVDTMRTTAASGKQFVYFASLLHQTVFHFKNTSSATDHGTSTWRRSRLLCCFQ